MEIQALKFGCCARVWIKPIWSVFVGEGESGYAQSGLGRCGVERCQAAQCSGSGGHDVIDEQYVAAVG